MFSSCNPKNFGLQEENINNIPKPQGKTTDYENGMWCGIKREREGGREGEMDRKSEKEGGRMQCFMKKEDESL